MPKNTTGGKKHKRAKNVVKDEKILEGDNEFQFYAKVNKKLGGGTFSVDVFIPEKRQIIKVDGESKEKIVRPEEVRKDQIALIRGSIKKRCRIDVGNLVLVSLREFEKKKVDIIHSYKVDDANTLKRLNKLPKSKIFENDDNSDINFRLDENEDNEGFDIEYNEKYKTNYSSNYDLIPEMNEDSVSEDEIDNL